MNKITDVYFDLLHKRIREVSGPVYPLILTLHQTGSILFSYLSNILSAHDSAQIYHNRKSVFYIH